MFGPDHLNLTFDDSRRILHLGYKEPFHIATEIDLKATMTAFDSLLCQLSVEGRIYLIIDMSNLIIEPELSEAYAHYVRHITETHVMPGGIARHGYQITRITVRRGYAEYLDDSPNIFGSREEAYEYIYSLIARQQGVPPVMAAPGEGR